VFVRELDCRSADGDRHSRTVRLRPAILTRGTGAVGQDRAVAIGVATAALPRGVDLPDRRADLGGGHSQTLGNDRLPESTREVPLDALFQTLALCHGHLLLAFRFCKKNIILCTKISQHVILIVIITN